MDTADIEELLQGDGGVDGEGLQHHSGADAALGALLGLKKSGRKRGTLEAQRQGYQIRLRALDLLEVGVVSHIYGVENDTKIIFPFGKGQQNCGYSCNCESGRV